MTVKRHYDFHLTRKDLEKVIGFKTRTYTDRGEVVVEVDTAANSKAVDTYPYAGAGCNVHRAIQDFARANKISIPSKI